MLQHAAHWVVATGAAAAASVTTVAVAVPSGVATVVVATVASLPSDLLIVAFSPSESVKTSGPGRVGNG